MSADTQYRVCATTGLKIFGSTQALIKANAVAAVVFLAIGGLFGLGVALTRWPDVHLLPMDWFYLVLTAHGLDVLLCWIVFFEVAFLYLASSVLLNCRLAAPKMAWLGFWLMIIGAVLTNITVLQGESTVMFTSYTPLQAKPNFYLGLILFAVGVLIACGVFFGTLVIAKDERTYEGSVPLVTFGALTAAIICVFTMASGAIILVPTWLWSLGYIGHIDPLLYKLIWWALGHSSQQVNVSVHVSIWYAVAAILLGAKPLSEKASRLAFLLYIFFLQLASAHHLLVEPGVGTEWKIFNTSYAMYLAVLGSMIHAMTVPGTIEAAQRKLGFNKGVFEWLRKAPWGNPAFAGVFLSLVLFGFLGGISGVVLGTEQINLIMHNTLYAPGHFHATVVLGTTLTFMSVTYLLVPLLFQREIMFPRMAKIQPYVFALGASGISLFMMAAGTLGVPRRHWDITFADALFPYQIPSAGFLMMALNGISAVIAATGGVMYIVNTVASVFFGKRTGDVPVKTYVPKGMPVAARAPVAQAGSAGTLYIPGTIVLVGVFFISFVLYYYVNWKYLAEVWPLR
ncbi:MAG: cbb3-type cytochrome c oxidase subunit I [Gammaproteobacteria bacterium]|nr:cbb3-type cytochrome c oxidase subunit I [Gammaproteobacteria bacterium]